MITTWFKGSALIATTLAAGIAIGVMAERAHMHHGDSHADSHNASSAQTDSHRASAAQMIHENVMQTLHDKLGIDSSQQKAIMETLHRHQVHIDSAWETMRPHVNATLDSAHTEIMGLLRPEQREAFRRLIMTHAQHGTNR